MSKEIDTDEFDDEFTRPDVPALNGYEKALNTMLERTKGARLIGTPEDVFNKSISLYNKGYEIALRDVENYIKGKINEINSYWMYRPRTMIRSDGGTYLTERCYVCGKVSKWYSNRECINKCSECGHEFIGNIGSDW